MSAILDGLHAAIDAAFAQRSAELAARSLELDRREADLAAAAELLSVDARVTAAMAQGQDIERTRLHTLISLQLEHLSTKSAARLVLLNLKRMLDHPLHEPTEAQG